MGGNRRRKSDYRAGPPGRSASSGCAVGGWGGQVAPPSVPVWCRGIACLIPSLRAINFVLQVDFGSPTFEGSVSHCCIRWTPRRAGRLPRRLCAAGGATRSNFQAKRRAPPAPPTPKYPWYAPPAPQPPHTFLDAGGNRRRKSDCRAGTPRRRSSRAAPSTGGAAWLRRLLCGFGAAE